MSKPTHDGHIENLTTDEIMETLTEAQAKFILHAAVIAGHLPRYWLDQGVKLSRSLGNV